MTEPIENSQNKTGEHANSHRYKLRPVTKPLPKQKPIDPLLRAENEDDDGYDPYSDYQPRSEFFEKDPWR